MIKSIVFDLGNVLISYDPETYMNSFELESALKDEVYKAIFKSKHWLELDKGTITEKEAIGFFCEEIPQAEEYIKKVMSGWKDMLLPIPETVELLKELKNKGYKLFVLSNYHKDAFEKTSSENEFFTLLDGSVVSYEVKCLKPEKKIYEHLLSAYDLKPEETLFIDDMEANVRGAQEVGIQGVLFQGVEQLRTYLEEIKVLL